jgi:predicted ATPase/class 3 adenylate cyclase/DNA-binding CsgD family transcriptional regulator
MMRAVGRAITTFVLGDVVGSTRRWEADGEEMVTALAALDATVDDATAARNGERPIEQGEGDSFVVTFPIPSDALAFAIDVQRAGSPLAVRMAVHTGEAERRDDGRWLGTALNRAARIRALAAGGQVLVSAATAELTADHLPTGASLRDLGQHRLRDLTAPERIRQLCHPDLPSEFPPLASLDRLPNNLPVELTSFIGREQEVEDLVGLLEAKRLITLTGAGGCGKTRLAVEVGARVIDRCPDGVWLADLASTADPALAAHALASAVGVGEQPLQTMTDTVIARLAGAQGIVILDNCEHVLDSAGELVNRLVRECPDIKILATSREALAVEGESAYRLASLELPADDDDMGCSAARLFIDRATAVRQSFVVDDLSRGAIATLCRRLDGLPLAIELAAARCRAMAPAEIAEQLGDRFRILTAGRQSALPRQRTLEASVRWSHDLLSGPERAVLRRLSVFAGGFSLAGAERVGGFGEVEELQVVDLLTSLVDKSLVHVVDLDGRTRYRLLETIRVFAAEQLDAAGELVPARDRHLLHMVTVAESSGFEDFGPQITDRFIELEIDDLRAARDWGIERGDGAVVFRLLAATGAMWEQWLPQELMAIAPAVARLDGGSTEDRMRFVYEVFTTALNCGDRDGAARAATEAARLAAEGADERLGAISAYIDALQAWAEDDPQAIAAFDRAVGDLRRLDVSPYLAWALSDSAVPLMTADQVPAALARMDEALAVAGARGSTFASLVHGLRAMILPRLGRFEEAEQSASRVLDGAVRMPVADVFALAGRAVALSARGEHDEAVTLADRSVAEAKRYTIVGGIVVSGGISSWVRLRAGLPLDAVTVDAVGALAATTGAHYATTALDHLRASAALALDDPAAALALARRAEAQADQHPFAALEWANTRSTAARVALARGDLGGAEEKALAALTGAVASGQKTVAIEAMETLARVASALEAHDEAARLLGATHARRRRVGWSAGRAEESELGALRLRLSDALGDEVLEVHLGEGAAMSDVDVVAYASRGRGERKRPSFGWESLTPTEREVVELVADGLRNKDVAAKLFMSPATVKTHLTHVFAKLGMTGRGELTAAVAARRRR